MYPPPQGRYLAVAASLTGGNALATFVRMVQMWWVGRHCQALPSWQPAIPQPLGGESYNMTRHCLALVHAALHCLLIGVSSWAAVSHSLKYGQWFWKLEYR